VEVPPQKGIPLENTGTNCLIAAQHGSITKLRPIDIGSTATSSTSPLVQDPFEKSLRVLDPTSTENVVSVTDPRLTLEIRRLIHLLDLPAFRSPSSHGSPFPLDHLGQNPREVRSAMTPYALLAVCLQSFTRRIVLSGLDVAQREKVSAHAQILPQKAKNKAIQDRELDISLLTPSHLLTGIRSRGIGNDRTDQAVLLCLSGLGTLFATPKGQAESRDQRVMVRTGHP
jgi:hypothetical protein